MRMEMVLEERKRIVEEGEKGSVGEVSVKLLSPRQTAEAKALETLRRKQEAEIKQALKNQELLEERRAKNQLKEEAASRRESERKQH